MRFPILIKIGQNRIANIVNSIDELPLNKSFKILHTSFDVDNMTLDVEYRVITDPLETEESNVVGDEQLQLQPEGDSPFGNDGADNSTSSSS